MSKKYLVFLIPITLIMIVALLASPGSVAASKLLGITITPTPETPPPTEEPPIETEPPPTEEPPIETEPPPTEEPPVETEPPVEPQETPKPKPTQEILLPETGEFPIDPGQALQWLFAFTLFLLIGAILYRTVKGSKPQS
jgi:outer membrane biosynthesis protein TonB